MAPKRSLNCHDKYIVVLAALQGAHDAREALFFLLGQPRPQDTTKRVFEAKPPFEVTFLPVFSSRHVRKGRPSQVLHLQFELQLAPFPCGTLPLDVAFSKHQEYSVTVSCSAHSTPKNKPQLEHGE